MRASANSASPGRHGSDAAATLPSRMDEVAPAVLEAAPPKKRACVSKTARAGLTFPVTRVARSLKKHSGVTRVGALSEVYFSAVMEYLAQEVLDDAARCASADKRKRLTPSDVATAVRTSRDLRALCEHLAVAVPTKPSVLPRPPKPQSKVQPAAN